MKTRLALSVLSFVLSVLCSVSAGAQAPPASSYRVKVPTAGDFVVLAVPVVNLSNDTIVGETFAEAQSTTGFNFVQYSATRTNGIGAFFVAPHSSGFVDFEIDSFGLFTTQTDFQLTLFGFPQLSGQLGKPDFAYNDPGLKIDIASENAGSCGPLGNCVTYTLPYTITVPAPAPEASSAVAFGGLLLGGVCLLLCTRKRQGA